MNEYDECTFNMMINGVQQEELNKHQSLPLSSIGCVTAVAVASDVAKGAQVAPQPGEDCAGQIYVDVHGGQFNDCFFVVV